MTAAVEIRGLRKVYGDTVAVRDIDLIIEPGEILALLGPNGAGKTTTVEILEGFRPRDAGSVAVLGIDPAQGGRALRERVGIVLQSSGIDQFLTVREVLALYAGYYPRSVDIDELLETVGLSEKAGSRVRNLSGGQQRRVDLALGLVGDPELVFLDEPTTGFDPSARRGAWEVVTSLRGQGKTVLLTTHYMDEAQHLADRVAVMSGGSLVALGPPDQLGDATPVWPPCGSCCRTASRPTSCRWRCEARATGWCSRPTRRRRSCTASPAGRWSGGSSWPV